MDHVRPIRSIAAFVVAVLLAFVVAAVLASVGIPGNRAAGHGWHKSAVAETPGHGWHGVTVVALSLSTPGHGWH